jgi:ribosomal protein L16 Arg81 hydroxylase
MKTLQQILSPYAVEQFLAENWTKQAIHIAAKHSQKLQPFFSWADLNNLLNHHRLEASDLHFSKLGQSLPSTRDRQEWSARLRQGATLILDGVHHRVPHVMQLAADLRHEIGYETHVNLYCSPAEQQGFDCHYDTHDVFILQIEGEKKWVVYRETVLYPTSELPSAHQPKPEAPPYIDCVLKPGDVLYIPRGHWHYAVAGEQPSLHLTVGIENQSGLNWLGWLGQELHERPEWRQSLPILTQPQVRSAEQQLEHLRQDLLAVLQQPDVLTRFLDAIQYRNLPPFPVQLPSQMGTEFFPDGFMTRFMWSPLHRLQVNKIDPESYQVQMGTKQITLKGMPDELANQLFARSEFTMLEIADWVPDASFEGDIVPLLTPLVTAGVLQVKTEQ